LPEFAGICRNLPEFAGKPESMLCCGMSYVCVVACLDFRLTKLLRTLCCLCSSVLIAKISNQ
jgi:hypothetical protein